MGEITDRILSGHTQVQRAADALTCATDEDRLRLLAQLRTLVLAHAVATRRCFYARLHEVGTLRTQVAIHLHREREIAKCLKTLAGPETRHGSWQALFDRLRRLLALQADQDRELCSAATRTLNKAELRDLAVAYDVVKSNALTACAHHDRAAPHVSASTLR